MSRAFSNTSSVNCISEQGWDAAQAQQPPAPRLHLEPRNASFSSVFTRLSFPQPLQMSELERACHSTLSDEETGPAPETTLQAAGRTRPLDYTVVLY